MSLGSVKMDGAGDDQAAEWYLMDAIDQDSTAVFQQYGEEEAGLLILS
jgi:hypothetical protein